MLFNSVLFLLVFFPATLLLFNFVKQRSNRGALWLILLASLVFYSWWDWRFTPLLLASICINYAYGRFLRMHRSRWAAAFGIVLNLAPLALFKYAGWIEGMVAGQPVESLVLPLGLSFFTFLQIGYLVSILRGTCRDEGFLAYAAFVCYFPHLIAGPILKHDEVVPQLKAIDTRPLVLDERFGRGLLLLVVGLFKKVIVADVVCSTMANAVFDAGSRANFVEAWTGALAYSCQLYFDFSGYCEMALGMSLMMGISIPINFRSPYRSRTIAEFWRSWHISLGGWFREHVYVPLGGSKSGPLKTVVAISATFFLTGLWHGAGWTFVAWGCMHGAYMLTYRAWSAYGRALPDWLARTATLLAVVFAWVVFRAADMHQAVHMWQAMLGWEGFGLGPAFAQFADHLPGWVAIQQSNIVLGNEVLVYGSILVWCAMARNVHEFDLRPSRLHAAYIGAMALVAIMFINNPSRFLYFDF